MNDSTDRDVLDDVFNVNCGRCGKPLRKREADVMDVINSRYVHCDWEHAP